MRPRSQMERFQTESAALTELSLARYTRNQSAKKWHRELSLAFYNFIFFNGLLHLGQNIENRYSKTDR